MVCDKRVWFITGASSGLGRALAEAVLEAGECLVATVRQISALEDLQSQYGPSRVLVVEVDVTSNEQIDSAFHAMIEHFGRVDVVVNNAGYAILGEIEALPEDAARKLMNVLFWGPVYISKWAARTVREVNKPGQGAVIFNISSVGGFSANPGLAFYSAGKFALEGFSESFSKEMLPEWNIKTCIVEPGGFETKWRGSTEVYEQHPAYAGDPSGFRSLRHSVSNLGDPTKAAKALIQLSRELKLPMRIALGSDALAIIQTKVEVVARDAEKWAKVSRSTDKDGVDGVAYGKMIVEKLRKTANN